MACRILPASYGADARVIIVHSGKQDKGAEAGSGISAIHSNVAYANLTGFELKMNSVHVILKEYVPFGFRKVCSPECLNKQ
ncbi:hypothetical protein D9M68_923690 [compost metagenome]